MIGQDLGHYHLESKLGEGGMGAVYKAFDKNLQRYSAIKVLPPALAVDKTFVERFLREARSIAKIRHPNLMHIYTVGEKNGIYYFAMEYIAGKTLNELIRIVGKINLTESFRLVGQVMSALSKVHKEGIVHRDLKPGNIIIDNENRAILMDFGLAKDRHEESNLTSAGVVLGTPEYMSPEQAMGENITTSSDIYALGIVLYEMLTGDTPFHAPSAIQILRMQCEVDPERISKKCADLPREVDYIVHKAIAKKQEERYSSLAEMAADMVKLVHTPELSELAKSLGSFDPLSVTATGPSSVAPKSIQTKRTINEPVYTGTKSSPGTDPTARTLKLSEKQMIPPKPRQELKPEPKHTPLWVWITGGACVGLIVALTIYFMFKDKPQDEPQKDPIGKTTPQTKKEPETNKQPDELGLPPALPLNEYGENTKMWTNRGEKKTAPAQENPKVTVFLRDGSKKSGILVQGDSEFLFLSDGKNKPEKIPQEAILKLKIE